MFTVADVNSDQFSLIAFFNCLQKTFVLWDIGKQINFGIIKNAVGHKS
jgi:hypothetical protein